MKIVLWIRGCFTIIQNQPYSTPTNIAGRHQSYTKNDSNIWDPKIVGQKSQGPKLSLSAHQVQVIQTLQVNSYVSGAAHPGIGDFKKRELFEGYNPFPKKDHLAKIRFFFRCQLFG